MTEHVSIQDVVRGFLSEKGDYTDVDFVGSLRIALQGFSGLNIHNLKSFKIVQLDINELRQAELPADFINWSRIGVVRDGKMVSFDVNDDILLVDDETDESFVDESVAPEPQEPEITYQITFDADGGTGGETQTVAHGVIPTPPTVTKEDYTFVEWSPSVVAATEEATYVAVWELVVPQVGDEYKGGVLFYILQSGDPGYESGKVKGLIASLTEPIASEWGAVEISIATSVDLGQGKSNTDLIVTTAPLITKAADRADSYAGGGYNDWYLPSRAELMKMQEVKALIPGIATTGVYWSSSQANVQQGWCVEFGTGEANGTYPKSQPFRVRPTRSFELINPGYTPPVVPEIGDTYEGGVVVYILQEGDEGYVTGKHKGLIIKPESIGTSVWSNVETKLFGTNPLVGYGAANTLLIINQEGHVNSAAKLCDDYSDGTYSDWYLLSTSEIIKVQEAASFLNLPPGDIFIWTSLESTLGTEAFKAYINKTGMTNVLKSEVVNVYPMRTFEIE